MDNASIAQNLTGFIVFFATASGALSSWLSEHSTRFQSWTPGGRKWFIFGLTALIGVASIGVGQVVSPAAAANLNVYATAFIGLVFAVAGAIINHAGINQLIPAIIQFVQAIAATRVAALTHANITNIVEQGDGG